MSEIRVDTISEKTSANGVAIDGVTIKDGGIAATAASTITVADNTDTLTLVSTDTDSAIGPNLNLYRNAGNGADADNLSTIAFAGNDDAGNATDFARITAQIDDASNGSEDVYVHHRTMLAGTERLRMSLLKAETVFNEESQDLDFRVESNGNTHMLFVDGGTNRIGMGTGTPSSVLHIAGDSSTDGGTITLSNADNSNTAFNDILFKTVGDDDSTLREVGSIKCLYDDHAGTNPSGNFLFSTRNDAGTFSERMRIDSSGHLSVGATSITNGGGYNKVIQVSGTEGCFSAISSNGEGLFAQNGYNTQVINRANGTMEFRTNNIVHQKISADGHVTMPKQSSFRVTPSSAQTNIAINTQVTIVFGAEQVDTNADFASNTFTAPVAGTYALNVNLYLQSLDSAAASYQAAILTSNDEYPFFVILPPRIFDADSGFHAMSGTAIADMDAGDTAIVRLFQEGGTQQTDINTSSVFTGHLLG